MKNPCARKINPIRERPLQRKIELTNWFVLGALLFISAFFAKTNFILGVLAGGLLSILNFYGLCRGLLKAFGQWQANQRLAKAQFIIKYLLRMALIGFVLYVLLVKTAVDIFGLILGLSTLFIAIILTIVMTFFDKNYLEEV